MARYISTPSRATGFANRCVYSTPGAYSFTVPDGVTSIKAITVGGGAPGSTGFVDDYSEVSQIACPGWKTGCQTESRFDNYRCYGYGFCGELEFNQYVKRSPFLLDKYAFGYTGAGGGYAEKTIPVTPGDSFSVTVGDEEETSSFFGTSGCLSATGASIPNVIRASSPCKRGWYKIDQFGNTTDTELSFCVNDQNICNPASSSSAGNTRNCAQWTIYSTLSSTCYKYSETLDCPVLCLQSSPGCGIGGDVNYTGGPSKAFAVKTISTNIYEYGCLVSESNCDCWRAATCNSLYICSHNFGCHSCTNCNSQAWDNIINSYSTYDDIENDCIGGACAVKLSGRATGNCSITNKLYCTSRNFGINSRSDFDTWEMSCCCCYAAGYILPAFKTSSADKQFLEANQGGASSGSPLGNGCTGGTGTTIFGSESETLICQQGSAFCPIAGNCYDQWCNFFRTPGIYCCEECGLQSFNYYSCCPSIAFFDRYSSPYKYGTKAEFEKEFNPIFNLNCDGTIMNPAFTLFPWKDKAGYADTCSYYTQTGDGYNKWWSGECYWAECCGCNCLNNHRANMVMNSCVPCCSNSNGCPYVSFTGMGIHYSCPCRYCVLESCVRIYTHSSCFGDNCCCGSCYNNCCLTGTTTSWVAAVCNQCMIRDDSTMDDIIDYVTAGRPWQKDMWNCFKYHAEGEETSDDHKKAWCAMCGQWNAMLYHVGFHNPYKCTMNTYCNCSSTSVFTLCKNMTNRACYGPSGVNYGPSDSCMSFICNGNVKSKVISAVDSSVAVVIPGSAGGPNAEGQSGYVLGDNEIYIAGTGADRSGSTQPQYILTSSGASMGKSTFDKIRSNYNGDLMAWYLNECWKYCCTDMAQGGKFCNHGCVCTLEGFECLDPNTQKFRSVTHYLGSSTNACCFGGGCFCFNNSCGGQQKKDYSLKLYACMHTELIRKFNLHTEESKVHQGLSTTCHERCSPVRYYTVIDVGSSGGIVISPKSKAFSGDPLCINTGGGSSVTSYRIAEHTVGSCNPYSHTAYLKYGCCGCCCADQYLYAQQLTACVDDSLNCKYHVGWSCSCSACSAVLPYFQLGHSGTGTGQYNGDSNNYMETSREVGGGGGDIFINEKYTGATLSDEYLFSSSDPVFGGTGQICVNGSTLYSLPGLTQGGSVGGCIVAGNKSQDVTQTAYSGGIFPKGQPGFGGGGTVCGDGRNGLVVVYWN